VERDEAAQRVWKVPVLPRVALSTYRLSTCRAAMRPRDATPRAGAPAAVRRARRAA